MLALVALRAVRQAGCSLAVASLASAVAGCSHIQRLGVGPVAVRPDNGKTSYGDELRLRASAGTSDGRTLPVVEAEGRLLLSERTHSLTVGLGPAYLRWLGGHALLASFTPALGAEYFDRTLLASAGLHGGLGWGVTLSEERDERSSSGMGWPEMEMGNQTPYVTVSRQRTLLTLELTGAVDARSRGVSYAAGLLVGLAWSEEQWTHAAPLRPPWGLRF
jgi:hypothetical protein